MRARAPLFGVLALLACTSPDTELVPRFEKTTLDRVFRGEGVTAFDVDGDGRVDIVTEQYWYEAPSWTPHEISEPKTYDPLTSYSTSFACFPMDVDRDGRTDLLVVPFPGEPMAWLRNPGPAGGRWERHLVVSSAAVETPVFDEREGRLYLGIEPGLVLAWLEPDPANVFAPWIVHAISGGGNALAARFHHGLGLGDMNGDGLADLLTTAGWFERPNDPRATPWTFHDAPLVDNECAQIYAFDFDGDGRTDEVCSSPHHRGIRWFEQTDDGRFAPHVIDESISETHAMRFEDLDGDGLPEIITGKRVYSHGLEEEGARDPARLVAISLARREPEPHFTLRDIDDDSGVGTAFEVHDIDGDGRLDIVTSNKKGLHRFTRVVR